MIFMIKFNLGLTSGDGHNLKKLKNIYFIYHANYIKAGEYYLAIITDPGRKRFNVYTFRLVSSDGTSAIISESSNEIFSFILTLYFSNPLIYFSSRLKSSGLERRDLKS